MIIKQPRQIVTDEMVEQALVSGVRRGECYEVYVCEDGRQTPMGLMSTKFLLNKWPDCFEPGHRPRLDRVYIAVSHVLGVYLVEI
jgi:hypothetical protein